MLRRELTTTKNKPNHAPRYDHIDTAIRYHMSFTNQDQLECLVSGRKQASAPYQDGDQRPAWNKVRN